MLRVLSLRIRRFTVYLIYFYETNNFNIKKTTLVRQLKKAFWPFPQIKDGISEIMIVLTEKDWNYWKTDRAYWKKWLVLRLEYPERKWTFVNRCREFESSDEILLKKCPPEWWHNSRNGKIDIGYGNVYLRIHDRYTFLRRLIKMFNNRHMFCHVPAGICWNNWT